MKKTFLLFIALIALTVTGCHNDSEYDLLPLGAADFISQYWPDPYIESVTTPSKGETQVVVKNGPTIVLSSLFGSQPVSINNAAISPHAINAPMLGMTIPDKNRPND